MHALNADLRERLAALPVPTITATLFGMGVRGFFLKGLRPLDPDNARFVALAYTMRAIPARDHDQANRHREGLAAVQPGQAIVTDCGGHDGISFFGELIATYLQRKDIAAIVTDAGIADTRDVAATRLPVFCQGSAPVPGPLHMVIADLQCPINCMGCAVYPGDILVGDAEGVAIVPASLAEQVAEQADKKERLERFLLKRLQQGAPLDGTYPPDDATLAEFQAGK